jgi:hypothetical protein
VEASAIEVKPSRIDFVYKRLLSPLTPSLIEPTIVREPIQKIKKAVINQTL